MTLEKLIVIIQAETAALEKSLNRVKSQLNVLDKASTRTGDRISSAFTGAASSINRAFKAIKIGALIAALSSFGRTALSSASNLQEWQNVVDVAFGDAVGQANLFAKIAIKQFGLSEIAAKKLTGTFMAMADGIGMSNAAGAKMAIQLSGLAADMASFFNSDYETTANALEAIFTGQSRALRQFGIVLSEANLEAFRLERGIETAYSQMNQAQKVALRYNYVLAMTANAQNDYARTAMSWANQMRLLANNWQQLASTVGSNLIKILAPAVAILNKILTMAIAVVNAIAKVFGGQGISGLATDAGGAVDGVAGGVEDIEDNFGGATKAAKKFKATIAGFDELEILKGPTDSGGSGLGGLGLGGIGVDDLDSYFEMYDEDGMLNQFESFMEKLKGMMDAGDWEGVGGEFAKGLNTIISAVDNFITDKLEPAGVKWAERIARVLNGLVSGFDWSGLGKTLGDGLNALIHIANTWYENFNSLNLGIGIGTSIMSWFTTVDWEGIGKYISNKLNFLGDILKGLAQTINFQQIKESLQTALANVFANLDVEGIKSAITTLVNGLVEVVKGLDWYQIGYTVGEMLSGVDWLGVFKTVKDAVWQAFKGFWNGLMSDGKNFLVGTIGKITSWFKDSFWGPFAAAVFGAIGTNIVFGGMRGFFKNTDSHWITEMARSAAYVLGSFGGLVPKTGNQALKIFDAVFGNGGTVSEAMSISAKFTMWKTNEGFQKGLSGIIEFFEGKGRDIKRAFENIWVGLTHPVDTIYHIFDTIRNAFLGLFDNLVTLFVTAWDKITYVAEGVVTHLATVFEGGFGDGMFNLLTSGAEKVFGVFTKLVDFLTSDFVVGFGAAAAVVLSLFSSYGGLAGVLERVKKVFSDVVGHVKDFANSIGFSDKIAALKDAFGGLWDALKKIYDWLAILKPVWEIFFTVITGLATTALDMIVGAINGFVEVVTGIIKIFTGILTLDIETMWEGIKQVFGGAIDFIVGIVKGFIDGIINFFKDLKYQLIGDPIVIDMWEGIKQIFSDAIEAVKNFVKGMVDKLIELWNNLKNKAIEIYTAIKDFLSETWDNIKTKTSEVWTAIKEYISTLWENIKTVFTNALNAIKTKISDIWNNIKTTTTNVWNGLKSTLSSVWDNLKTKASDISTSIKNAFVNAYKGITDKWNGFKSFFSGVWSGIADMCKSAMNNMISRLNQFRVNVPDWVPFIGGSSWGLSIPYLAKGGVITSPTVAMMGEYAGARNNPEIVAPQSLLKETIDASNGEMVSALYQIATQIISAIDNVDFSVSIGDDTIANAANRGNNAYKNRTGKPLFSM